MPKVKMPSKPVGTAASGPATSSPEAEAAGDEAASLIESGDGYSESWTPYQMAEDFVPEGFSILEPGDVISAGSIGIEKELIDGGKWEPVHELAVGLTVAEEDGEFFATPDKLVESSTVGEQPVAGGLVSLDKLFGEDGDAAGGSYLKAMDSIAEVGGNAWSKVEDPAAAIAEIRGSESDNTDNTLDDLFAAEEKCAAAELVVETLKGELKEAKEAYDDAVNDLRKLARGARQDRSRPLFGQPRRSMLEVTVERLGMQSDDAAAPSTSTAWRSRSIAELDLGDALSERLENASISTIGQLQDMQEQISLGREKWPKGIGAAKITKIEDAVIAWLAKNRDAGLLGGHSSSVPVTPVDESLSPLDQPIAEGLATVEMIADTADGLPGSDDPTDVVAEEAATEAEETATSDDESDAEVEHITKSWDELHEKAERTVVLRATSPEFESRFGQGMSDFQNGESHYACSAVDSEGQWNWMQGYVTAERAAAAEQFEAGAETEVELDPLADLADL